MDRYAVTVLPGQNLDDEKQTAFAALYGPLEVSPPVHSQERRTCGGAAHPQSQHLRRVQSRRERKNPRSRRSAPRLPPGQRALAHRQLVPAEVRDLVDAACPRRAAVGRRHRVRRHPRRLRRAARGDEGTDRRPRRRAFDLALARQARRLHADRRRAQGAPAGPASAGAAASGLRPQRALHRLPRLAHRRLAGATKAAR